MTSSLAVSMHAFATPEESAARYISADGMGELAHLRYELNSFEYIFGEAEAPVSHVMGGRINSAVHAAPQSFSHGAGCLTASRRRGGVLGVGLTGYYRADGQACGHVAIWLKFVFVRTSSFHVRPASLTDLASDKSSTTRRTSRCT